MGRFIVNLILVVVTGYALIWAYNNLLVSIKKNYSFEVSRYIAQNKSIDDLLSTHQKTITKKDVLAYDNANKTNLTLAINKTNTVRMSYQNSVSESAINDQKQTVDNLIKNALLSTKNENDLKVLELQEKEQSFWSYLPPTPTLIFGGIGIFFTALITNLGNTCSEKTPSLLTWLWNQIKKFWNIATQAFWGN